MPTSPRNRTGGTGLYKRTAQSSNPRDDEGSVPYAGGEFCHSSSPVFHFQVSPPHPPLRRHPLQAGEGCGSCNQIVTSSDTRRADFHPNTTTNSPEKQLGFLKISKRQGRTGRGEISGLRENCNQKWDRIPINSAK